MARFLLHTTNQLCNRHLGKIKRKERSTAQTDSFVNLLPWRWMRGSEHPSNQRSSPLEGGKKPDGVFQSTTIA